MILCLWFDWYLYYMLIMLLIVILFSLSNDNQYILRDIASSLDSFALFNHLFADDRLLTTYMIVLAV